MVAAVLLLLAGAPKLRSPDAAARALAGVGVGIGRVGGRALGGAELSIGLAALVHPRGAPAALLAGTYLAFAIALLRLRSRTRSADCGCLGGSTGPVAASHIVMDLMMGILAALAVRWPAHDVGWLTHQHAWVAATVATGLAGCVYGLHLAFTALPAAWRAYSPSPAP